MEAARARAELTIQDLWLRYLALGGTGDAFDLDGYLQGLMPLDDFQQDVLAQTLNEALDDIYQASRIPLSSTVPGELDDRLRRLVEQLLHDRPAAPPDAAPSSDDGR